MKQPEQFVLGLDQGVSSIGWALLRLKWGEPVEITDLGSRVFPKALEDNKSEPKNVKRRGCRLTRRVLDRRVRRILKMENFLISLKLLPEKIRDPSQREKSLNEIGDPRFLRTKALDKSLTDYEFGRVLLHLTARRGFKSSKKQALGDLINDEEILEAQKLLADGAENEDLNKPGKKNTKEGKNIKRIRELREKIIESGARTLGEYEYLRDEGKCKRNRKHAGGEHITDRQMYEEELELIWEKQKQYFSRLPDNFIDEIKEIIFYQRPLKLHKNRMGKCEYEPGNYRAATARLEFQRFRYFQDINHLTYPDEEENDIRVVDEFKDDKFKDSEKLVDLKDEFEGNEKVTFARIREILGLGKRTKFNLQNRSVEYLKGNVTATKLKAILSKELWDDFSTDQQKRLVDDLLTLKYTKRGLKKRLLTKYKFLTEHEVRTLTNDEANKLHKKRVAGLCAVDYEFEPGYANVSLKAMRNLLPWLEKGKKLSDARIAAGYGDGYGKEGGEPRGFLGAPPDTRNPLVNRALHETKRVVNSVVNELLMRHPHFTIEDFIIRVETTRGKRPDDEIKQEFNTKRRDKAKKFIRDNNENPDDNKLVNKVMLWWDQGKKCPYTLKCIEKHQLFCGNTTQVDHILPFKKCGIDGYWNKVVCFTFENRNKSENTPLAYLGNSNKWKEIKTWLKKWPDQQNWVTGGNNIVYYDKKLDRYFSKKEMWNRIFKRNITEKAKLFTCTNQDAEDRGFKESDLTNTGYIAKATIEYLKQLGCKVFTSQGRVTSQLRYAWYLNDLLKPEDANPEGVKNRDDHRHHALDAVVIAMTTQERYENALENSEDTKLYLKWPYENFKNKLQKKLGDIIISHRRQEKLTGELHEPNPGGYRTVSRKNEKTGKTKEETYMTCRVPLNDKFTAEKAKQIIDKPIRKSVENHLGKFENNPQKAFSKDQQVFHEKDGTPIYRVKINQTREPTTLEKLKKTKWPDPNKNKSGNPTGWLDYENTHHVEIIRSKNNGKYKGIFVTTMEASHRVRGVTSQQFNPGGIKQPMVKTNHGDNFEFITYLVKGDTVSLKSDNNGERDFFIVKSLDKDGNRMVLIHHTSAHLSTEVPEKMKVRKVVSTLMNDYEMQKCKVDILGRLVKK